MQPQKNILLVNDHEILKKLIASNEVVAILPETYMLGDYYEKHKLIKRIPMPKDFEMTVVYGCILYPQEDRMTVLEKCTVDLLKELLPR